MKDQQSDQGSSKGKKMLVSEGSSWLSETVFIDIVPFFSDKCVHYKGLL